MIAVFPLSEEEIVAKRASPSQRTTKEREKGRQYGRRFQMKTSQNGEREGGMGPNMRLLRDDMMT